MDRKKLQDALVALSWAEHLGTVSRSSEKPNGLASAIQNCRTGEVDLTAIPANWLSQRQQSLGRAAHHVFDHIDANKSCQEAEEHRWPPVAMALLKSLHNGAGYHKELDPDKHSALIRQAFNGG